MPAKGRIMQTTDGMSTNSATIPGSQLLHLRSEVLDDALEIHVIRVGGLMPPPSDERLSARFGRFA